MMFSRASRNVSRARMLGNFSIAAPLVVAVLGGTLLDMAAVSEAPSDMACALWGLVAAGIAAAVAALFMMKPGEKGAVMIRSSIGLAASGLLVAAAVSGVVGT